MTNHELGIRLGQQIANERKITHEILVLINLALEGRAYLELGYSTMFDWLTKGFGYSNASAFRRIEAARLLNDVPEAGAQLKDGRINLSTLSQVQTVIRAQEKISGVKVSLKLKKQIVEKIENRSSLSTEQFLTSVFPDTVTAIHQERRTVIDENQTRHQMNLPTQATADLSRLKEVLSHIFPFATDADIISYALRDLVKRKDPQEKILRQKAKVGAKLATFKKSNFRCTYKDPKTGVVCGTRYQLQVDHIKPRALGGTDDPDNLRILCRQHNLWVAEKIFGKSKMDAYRT